MDEHYACDVYLVDLTTGERAVYRSDCEQDSPDTPGAFSEFVWAEGNYSCDCNRALFFARALGREDPGDTPCGDTRYRVERIVRVSDGATLYQES